MTPLLCCETSHCAISTPHSSTNPYVICDSCTLVQVPLFCIFFDISSTRVHHDQVLTNVYLTTSTSTCLQPLLVDTVDDVEKERVQKIDIILR